LKRDFDQFFATKEDIFPKKEHFCKKKDFLPNLQKSNSLDVLSLVQQNFI
jgi:hypothetical protein